MVIANAEAVRVRVDRRINVAMPSGAACEVCQQV